MKIKKLNEESTENVIDDAVVVTNPTHIVAVKEIEEFEKKAEEAQEETLKEIPEEQVETGFIGEIKNLPKEGEDLDTTTFITLDESLFEDFEDEVSEEPTEDYFTEVLTNIINAFKNLAIEEQKDVITRLVEIIGDNEIAKEEQEVEDTTDEVEDSLQESYALIKKLLRK